MESIGKGRTDAAQQQRMVQRQPELDFFDSSVEWRRVFAETWGTFLTSARTAPSPWAGILPWRDFGRRRLPAPR